MRCLNCKTTIIEKGVQMEDGSFWLKPDESKKIQGDGSRSFVRCPNCQAKNYLEAWPESKKVGCKNISVLMNSINQHITMA